MALASSLLGYGVTAATAYFLKCYFFPRQAKSELNSILHFRPHERILIVAPHSDDEVLSCGGVIHQAVMMGCEVLVVVITNGDGFTIATTTKVKKVKGWQRFIDFGVLRQNESLSACKYLGLPRENICFLGYPDRGLHHLWTSHWDLDGPTYRSPYTMCDCNPYKNSYNVGVPYTGESLLRDLLQIMKDFQPTLVFAPHTCDVHNDHWAVHNFVRYALTLHSLEGDYKPNYLGYLIHRGNWPTPKGYFPKKPLLPPKSMLGKEWQWCWYPVEPQSTVMKNKATLMYRTQTTLMRRYMVSYSRVNELFAPINPFVIPSFSGVPSMREWKDISTGIVHPVLENVVRNVQGAVDISTVNVARVGQNLLINLGLMSQPQNRTAYRIKIRVVRPVGNEKGNKLQWLVLTGYCFPKGKVSLYVESCRPKINDIKGMSAYWQDKNIIFQLPVEDLVPIEPFFCAAEARYSPLAADRTGWQLFVWSN
jgi:LmbE family N-acetylglucosaminyl deacetylase